MLNFRKNLANVWLRGTLVAGGFIMAAILGGVLFHSPAVHAQLQDWKLLPAGEPYTELYFDHNLTLPTTVAAQPVTFAFSIHDVEGHSVQYPYVVALVTPPPGIVRVLAHGTISLNDGDVATVPEVLTLPKGTTAGEISVELPDQNQEIHFWLEAAK